MTSSSVSEYSDEDYSSMELSQGSDEDESQMRQSPFEKTRETLIAAYSSVRKLPVRSMVRKLRMLKPYSDEEARDIEEALRGDYKYYNERRQDIVYLPPADSFEQRLNNSAFDKMHLESNALKYQFFLPFLLKAELNPGLAFGEVFLTLVNVGILTSALTNGLSAMAMFIGCCSTYSLLSIIQFWYGMSRYPSIWNKYVPPSLKGSSCDRNFREIKDICGYHHNGHDEMNSQFIPFAVTLPFTFLFHATSFLVTVLYSALRRMKLDLRRTRFRDPVTTSIFVSNALVTSIWLFGGSAGMVYASMTIFFNQKVYNALMFKKDLKSFYISLVFGNFLVVSRKAAPVEAETTFSESATEVDLEEGLRSNSTAPTYDQSSATPTYDQSSFEPSSTSVPPMRYLPPLLGVSSSSSTNDNADHTMAPENISPAINDKVSVVQPYDEAQNDAAPVEENPQKESPIEVFSDEEIASQPSNTVPPQFGTVNSFVQDLQKTAYPENKNVTNNQTIMDELQELEYSKNTAAKKGFLGMSRRIFSGARTKYNRKNQYTAENHFDDQVSVESLNPLDVHLDLVNHTGTVEWRNIIIESTHKFKIKTYTVRKHTWVMGKMHGRSFFITGDGKRQRKLKRKEIKFHCQRLHDKQLLLNSQINGILDDLRGMKENISTKRVIDQSLSKSERSKFSFSNLPSRVIQTSKGMTTVTLTENGMKIKFSMADTKNETPQIEGASSAKDSLCESKDSTVSTLTNSVDEEPELLLDQNQTEVCINQLKEKVLQTDGDGASLKDAIDDLLKCGEWNDNINVLKDPQPLEKSDSLIDVHKTTEHPGQPPEDEPIGAHRGGATDEKKPYWQTYVDLPEVFKEKPKQKSYEVAYPWHSDSMQSDSSWRSELQKKKSEKAQEDRSQSREIALNQLKQILPILQNAQFPDIVGDENRDQQNDRQQFSDNGRCGIENLQETPWSDFSDCRNDFMDSPEVNTTQNKSPDTNFATECSAFEGMSEAYSQLTEQRDESVLPDESVLTGFQLISTNRVS